MKITKIERFFIPNEITADTNNTIMQTPIETHSTSKLTPLIIRSEPAQTMTTDTISLPCLTTPYTLHFGSVEKLANFATTASYFIESAYADESQNPDNKKHIITSVKYEPDSVYNMTDGHAGKCWKVGVYDAETETFSNYAIRNWCDLVYHYATTKKLEFVDCTKPINRPRIPL